MTSEIVYEKQTHTVIPWFSMMTPRIRNTQLMKCHIMKSFQCEKCWIFAFAVNSDFVFLLCYLGLWCEFWNMSSNQVKILLMFAYFKQQLPHCKHYYGKFWELVKMYLICISLAIVKLAKTSSGKDWDWLCECGWDLWVNEFVSKICTQAVASNAHFDRYQKSVINPG